MFNLLWRVVIYAITLDALTEAQGKFVEFGDALFGRSVFFVGDSNIDDDDVYATFSRDLVQSRQQVDIQLFETIFTSIKDIFYVRYSFGNYQMLQFGRIDYGQRINNTFEKTSCIIHC